MEFDWNAIYAQEAPFLGRMLLRMTANPAWAEEMVQETFLAAFRNLHTFDPKSAKLSTWLYAIARNLALRKLRDEGRFFRFRGKLRDQIPTDLFSSPEQELSVKQDAAFAMRLLNRLKPNHREILILHELEDRSGQEIAELLMLPINTVWTRLHHARKQFRSVHKKILPSNKEDCS